MAQLTLKCLATLIIHGGFSCTNFGSPSAQFTELALYKKPLTCFDQGNTSKAHISRHKSNMSNSAVAGTWVLRSFGLHPTEPPNAPAIFHPLGKSPLGRVIFTNEGYMSCSLTSAEAAAPMKSASWIQATDKEILVAARSLTTYCGSYKTFTNEDGEQLISTMVDVALDPNWIGKPQVRKYRLNKDGDGEILTLSPIQEFTLPVSPYLTY